MNTAPDTDFGREVITLLTDALSALLEGVNKLSEGNATWIDLNSFEYLIEDAKGQAMAALKSGEAYCAIPILKPGDHFTLRTDEQDLDEEGQERITPAGSGWIVQELEPDFDPLMQYAVHCPQTGASIHITHAELSECGFSTVHTREMAENIDNGLDEVEIRDFLTDRIESGDMPLEDITRMMARYGLMEPKAFQAEMQERMAIYKSDQDNSPSP